MEYKNAREFALFIKGLGFRAFVAESKTMDYGIITDAEGSRVLSFGFTDGASLSGNYGPPSKESGTGWRMDITPYDLKTAEDVRKALYAQIPRWCNAGPNVKPTTLEQHLGQYGSSSKYQEV